MNKNSWIIILAGALIILLGMHIAAIQGLEKQSHYIEAQSNRIEQLEKALLECEDPLPTHPADLMPFP